MSKKKVKVVLTTKACQMLKCSRTYFYNNYKKLLTVMPGVDKKNCVYLHSEVKALADKHTTDIPNYEIIK